jgi:hypothetical protein
MPRRERPATTTRSEHWLRVAVNYHTNTLNSLISQTFGWSLEEQIEWVSPIAADSFAEYYDQSFIDRLGIANLAVPLDVFWSAGGPRWDGLAKTASGKRIVVEAKAYIEEAVHHGTRASDPGARKRIEERLAEARDAFKANSDPKRWMTPFYQYTNRLAHLYFLRHLNNIDAYLLFIYFSNAPDVPSPCTAGEWRGAERLISKCLGLRPQHPFSDRVRSLIWSVPDMLEAIS